IKLISDGNQGMIHLLSVGNPSYPHPRIWEQCLVLMRIITYRHTGHSLKVRKSLP
ncbi:hypothetical protein HAX54_043272, partial [Datura stramonium]|nr:hypothetical protein [Datura stramonium]